MDFDKFLSFSRTLNAFARIERVIPMPQTDRMENDVEHSYHLALMAWYLIDSRKLDLDLSLVLKYALAHDLVEIHAGDTYVYDADEALHASKKEREAAAALLLQQDFPEFPDLHASIHAYEELESRESRFVYALDKIIPMLVIQEANIGFWKHMDVTLDMILEKKAPQVALSPEAEPYFNEIVAIIREAKATAEYP